MVGNCKKCSKYDVSHVLIINNKLLSQKKQTLCTKQKKTKSGVKVFQNGKHIKTIPSKYLEVVSTITFDNSVKRLTQIERLYLESELVRSQMKKSLDKRDRYAAERIEGSSVIYCIRINIRGGENRNVLVFDNGERIKCSCALLKFGSGTIENSLY